MWVKSGTYFPEDTIPDPASYNFSKADSLRMTAFILKNNVYLYGGFLGYETSIDQRQRQDINHNDTIEPWEYLNQTILTGNINSPSVSTDNCFHVIYGSSAEKELCFINGFIIKDGNSEIIPNGISFPIIQGAGAIDANIENCIITQNNALNSGGGLKGCFVKNSLIYNNVARHCGGILSSEAYNCIIRKNFSSGETGGVTESYCYKCVIDSNKSFNGAGVGYGGFCYKCIISSNVAQNMGGGLFATNAQSCLIINNKAGELGGAGEAMHGAFSSYSTLTNCIIVNNQAPEFGGTRTYHLINCIVARNKGGVYGGGGAFLSNIYNSILWGNSGNQCNADGNYAYCAIQGGYKGANNILLDTTNMNGPMFVNPSDSIGNVVTKEGLKYILNANWSLLSGSRCIDSGNYKFVPDSIKEDFGGNIRIMGTNVDIGAHEFPGAQFINPGPETSIYDVNSIKSEAIKVYPTITNNNLFVESLNDEISQVVIVSSAGSRLLYKADNTKLKIVSMKDLKSGVYFIIVYHDKEVVAIKKVIKVE